MLRVVMLIKMDLGNQMNDFDGELLKMGMTSLSLMGQIARGGGRTSYIGKNMLLGEISRQLLHGNDKDASKPVARHFNLPYHSKQHMAVCGLSLHLGSSESRKTLEQKFIFQIGTLNPHGINERFSFN